MRNAVLDSVELMNWYVSISTNLRPLEFFFFFFGETFLLA